ncbi:MAG TPA: M36 family metallopeptidase [Thermoanaerobaculia bacterium]|nr:M36 family metallopeptidase [Thermoanaerobaculia bacterium]
MPWTFAKRRRLAPTLFGILILALSAVPGWAAKPPTANPRPPGNFDLRVTGSPSAISRVVAGLPTVPLKPPPTPAELRAQVEAMQQALNRLRVTAPGAKVRFSPVIAGPEVVAADLKPLSGDSAGAGIDIVRNYLKANSTLYGLSSAEIDGLHFLGESLSKRNGMRMVRVEQLVNGRPVFQSETRFIVDRSGRVWRSLGLMMPNASALPLSLPPAVSAPQALVKAMQAVGVALDVTRMSVASATANGAVVQVAAHDAKIAGNVASDVVYFPVGPGVLVPAWRQVTFTKTGADWYTVIDANTGALLWRKNIRAHVSTQEARFSVYVQGDGKTPAISPAPHDPTDVNPGDGTQFPAIARTTVNMSVAQDITASPDGWISDGGTTTTGNNVDAYLDTDADNLPDTGLLDNNGRPVGNPDGATNNRDFLGATPRDFNYTPAPLGGNPDAGDDPNTAPYQRGVVTHLFYLANWYHDQLYNFGFDEAAGNFQTTNFSGMGLGGDPVLAEAQDGDGTDNANFSTPPDGQSGRMQMFIFDFPTPERDGALDATIVLHEMTHGLSNRLIGDSNGLIWDIGSGMGEGWSDFYALSLTHGTNAYPPNAKYPAGAYATYQLGGLTDNYLYGIRRFPYSTDNTVNPLTWADVDDATYNEAGGIPSSPLGFGFNGALEVHNVGEIWALSLWEVRSRVIADPAGANGDVPTGNATMLQLVTDALKMTPINPSFTDARDAIIDADCITNACANEASIWGGFADRGLGYKAVSPLGDAGGVLGIGGYNGVGESFKVPYLDVNSTTVDDSSGNNNGFIDPGEPIRLTVELVNPWKNAAFGVPSVTATLTSSTPGVTIFTGSSTYPAIPAKNTASGTPFLFTLSTAALCGQSLHFTLTTTSTLGTTSVDFVLRVGNPTGVGAPITYTRTVPGGGLAIPDDDFNGVTDSFAITDDKEINSVQFRIDNLTHTFTGDLTVALKGPNGYGTNMDYIRGFFIGDGDGDNFVNTLFDDNSVNDLNLSASTDAPYSQDWLPAFNSPIWALFGIPNLGPDPVGQLSRLDGLGTQGTWQVHVSDQAFIDTGKLNSWSLLVTPTAFTCAAFAPTVAVSGTKTVSGTFAPGGTVTYTVTLTNNGSGGQADNPGDEFVDVLPSQLALVSASATSGTALATVATNTVTWNGQLAPAGGSTTITITATVNPCVSGVVSNQGTIHFDADANGTNESTTVTDDPSKGSVGGTSDPTTFTVAPAPCVSATKSVNPTGTVHEGDVLTYTVTLTNSGTLAQGDNPGHEFTDTLPSGVTFGSVTASSGTAAPGPPITWDGSIPAGGSVTITITATVNSGTSGQSISNQGTFSFDANGDGTNDTTGMTDDPATAPTGDPTTVVVSQSIAEVPTLSDFGLAALCLALTGAALFLLRRRRTA